MNYQVGLVLATLVVVAVDGLDDFVIRESCNSFADENGSGELVKAESTGDCTTRCTFRQYYDQDGGAAPSAGGGGGGGSGDLVVASNYGSSDPLTGISQNRGGTVEITVEIGANELQPCGEKNKFCVLGECTAHSRENEANCQQNLGNNSIAVVSSNKCYINCLRLADFYQTGGAYNGHQGRQLKKGIVIVTIPKPNRGSCGEEEQMCSGGYCFPKANFPGPLCTK